MSVMTFCAYGLVITLCIPRRDWYQAKPSRMGILAWKRSNRLSSCLAYLTSSDFSSFSLSLTERNIAKGTADPRVSALTKVIAFKPYRSTQLVYSIKFKLSHAIQLQNLDQISASKSWPKIYFKIFNIFNIVVSRLNLYQTSASKLRPNLSPHVPQHQHQQHLQHQEVLSWHLQRPESHQLSLQNRSQCVS